MSGAEASHGSRRSFARLRQAQERHPWLLVFAAGVAARLATSWALDFDGRYGQDAYAYVEAARQLAAGQGYRAATPGGVPIPLGQAPGYSLALAGLFALGWPARWMVLWSALCAALPGALAADLASRWCRWGWWAGAAVTLSPILFAAGVLTMPEAQAAALSALGLWAALRWELAPARGWPALAAGALALAACTRYEAALLAIPAGLIFAGAPRPRPADLLAALAAGALGLAPLAILERSGLGSYLDWFSWSPAVPFRRAFGDGPDGTIVYPLPVALMVLARLCDPRVLSPLLVLVGLLAGRRRMLLWTGPAALLLFLSGVMVVNPRNLAILAFPVGLLAASGLERLRLSRALAAAVLLTLGAGAAARIRWLASIAEEERVVAAEVRRLAPGAAMVVAFNVSHGLAAHTALPVVDLSVLRESPPAPAYGVWRERDLERLASLAALAEGRTVLDRCCAVEPVGSAAGYAIVRIRPR